MKKIKEKKSLKGFNDYMLHNKDVFRNLLRTGSLYIGLVGVFFMFIGFYQAYNIGWEWLFLAGLGIYIARQNLKRYIFLGKNKDILRDLDYDVDSFAGGVVGRKQK